MTVKQHSRVSWLKKWALTIRILPIVGLIVLAKFGTHWAELELIAPNPLLPTLVAGTVFLIGFLLSGVLVDYKEAEKLPGEIVLSLETLSDEAATIYKGKQAPVALRCLSYIGDFASHARRWLMKEERTKVLLGKLEGLSDFFLAFEPLSQPTFLSRLKQEQHSLRRSILRIHTIRETSFIQSGYAIVEVISFVLIGVLLLTKIEPFYESMLIMFPITYLLIYMPALIKDLDNPFDYRTTWGANDEVSLFELEAFEQRIADRISKLQGMVKVAVDGETVTA
jgi:hypothetical protein